VEQTFNPRLTLIGLSGTGVRSENWDLVHQTLSANCNRSGTELDVHERLVPVTFLGSFLMLGLGAITKWSTTSTQDWKDAGRVFNNLCQKLPLQWFWRYAILVAQETRRDWWLTFERYCKPQHNSLLWGCAGDRVEMVVKCIVGPFWGRIFNMGANSSPKTVPHCTLTTISTQSPARPQSGE